jgi:hypothetical protein
MNVVFLGAGASYGSDTVGTPPLGPNLFDELASFDPSGWGSLPDPWPRSFQQDFEQGMSNYINEELFAASLQWSVAEYFFKGFSIRPSNLYIKLLRQIEPYVPDFAVAAINYDTLLFQAEKSINVSIELGARLHPRKSLPVCLPHGSSIMYCDGIKPTKGLLFSYGMSTGGTPKRFTSWQHFDDEKNTTSLPPVMSYFEPNKFTASCSNFIMQERETFANWVSSASKIAIIGVNIHLADEHIWNPLAATNAQLLYLSGKSSGDNFSQWASQNSRTGDIVSPNYFRQGYGAIESFFEFP